MKIKPLWLWVVLLLVTACSGQLSTLPAATPTASNPTPALTPVLASTLQGPTPILTPVPLPGILFDKGPYLVPGANFSSLNVLWQASSAANYWLEYGLDTAYASGKITPQPVSEDGLVKAALTDLQPGSHYEYRVSDGRSQASGSFNTPAADAGDLTFWVYGDSRSGPQIQNSIAADILTSVGTTPAAQSFVLFSGDIMNVAEEASLQANQFDPAYSSLRQLMSELPLINAMGNHDGTQLFIKYFPYTFRGNFYWSFDYGPAHIAVVDQYADVSEASPQWVWLKQDLETSAQPWKFILLHEPGWSAGYHPNSEVVQKIIQPIASREGVAVIFAGHNHYYARAEVNGVVHITTGGGGAPLYDPAPGSANVIKTSKEYHYLKAEIQGNKLTVTALTPQNQVIDQFTLSH